MTTLIPAFFVTAILYAMVGFGGGSTYNALLVLADTDYRLLPSLALACNIIVVSGGAYHFSRAEGVRWPALLPFVCLSVPMAWLGGRLPVAERLFVGLLGLALLAT
ncbi:MAG: TSUP family transporter, partial [Akkermansiaceae bacterium]|nr:TSUP family transporter [Akkermansiaceae bacterium]